MECVDISINADGIDEVNEMFSVNLDTDDSSVILDPQSAPVTIIDGDGIYVYWMMRSLSLPHSSSNWLQSSYIHSH